MYTLYFICSIFYSFQAEGYGARWSADGTRFRGFVEPQVRSRARARVGYKLNSINAAGDGSEMCNGRRG